MAKRKKPTRCAVIGAGMAGLACARTLMQAGWDVTVLDKGRGPGGRMACRDTPFGTFDHGAQYFTVRDDRLRRALDVTAPDVCRPWSATTVRVLDAHGHVLAAGLPAREPHWVAVPGMNALARRWAQPLADRQIFHPGAQVTALSRDAGGAWWLSVRRQADTTAGSGASARVDAALGPFDAVMLAIPAPQALELLRRSAAAPPDWLDRLAPVAMAPCWTMLIAFPQAMQPGLDHLGPHWNAARSTHHRITWLARESSKPGRGPIERWTVQASAEWSAEHLEDDAERVQAKMLRAFAELTGIRAEPVMAQMHRWRFARTLRPLGVTHLWSPLDRLGLCGDWCLGHRVEDAFVSGLELALAACNAGPAAAGG